MNPQPFAKATGIIKLSQRFAIVAWGVIFWLLATGVHDWRIVIPLVFVLYERLLAQAIIITLGLMLKELVLNKAMDIMEMLSGATDKLGK